MTKISKNIKKLRQAKGLTQDALAQKIHVTRQAVSSWENGRTQPDLDMLDTLSLFFNIPVEQLIYGEKFNTSLDDSKAGYPRTATVLFSVLGSLLVFAGLLLIFITGWEKLPKAVQLAFAFLPMLGGQACALLVHFKKSNSISFREGSSVIWTVGVIATVALTNAISSIELDTSLFLLIAILLVIPIFTIMHTVAPLAVFYVLTACFQAMTNDCDSLFHNLLGSETFELVASLALTGLIFSIGFAFCFFVARRLDKQRRLAAFWLSLSAVVVFIIISCILAEASFWCASFACAIALYVLDSFNKTQSFSTKYLSLPAVFVMMLIMSAGVSFATYGSTVKPITWVISLLPVAALVASIVISKKSFASDKFKIPEVAIMTVTLVACATIEYVSKRKADSPIYVDYDSDKLIRCLLFEFLTFILSVIVIIHGTKENSLFKINLGFISIGVVIFLIMLGGDFELYAKGIVLLILGAGLLLINCKSIAKKKKLLEKAEGQVTDNE